MSANPQRNKSKRKSAKPVRKPVMAATQNKQASSSSNRAPKPKQQLQHLGPIGRDYCRALTDPKHATPCGVPDALPLPTRKLKCWSAGSFHTSSTSSVGFVAVAPRAMLANDTHPVVYSTSAYTGTTFAPSGTAGVSYSFSNIEYDTAKYVSGSADSEVQGRVVGCVLTVQYTGTDLNCGGEAYLLHDPTHSTIMGRDVPSLNQELQTHRHVISSRRDKLNVMFSPALSSDTTFTTTMSQAAGGYIMGILVVAPSTTVLSFRYEVYAIVEVQGADARGQTHSMANPMDYAAVNNAVKLNNGTHVGEPSLASQFLHTVANEIRSGAVDIVGGVARNLGRGAVAMFRTAALGSL